MQLRVTMWFPCSSQKQKPLAKVPSCLFTSHHVPCLHKTRTHLYLPYVVQSLPMMTFAWDAQLRQGHIYHERTCLQRNTPYHFNWSLIHIILSLNPPIVSSVRHILLWNFVPPSQLRPILLGLEGPQRNSMTLIWSPIYLPHRLSVKNDNDTSVWEIRASQSADIRILIMSHRITTISTTKK